jgi:D-arabinose 1-dehydrogenase-like Zn-dependent alcohol dehydrogenase
VYRGAPHGLCSTHKERVNADLLSFGARRSVAGWPAGSSIDSEDTLACALTGVRPVTQLFPLERAAEGYEHMMTGKARFRVVLTPGG